MANYLNRWLWLIVLLFSTELSLIVWISPCLATDLRDIRIGEYDTFSRIVFEFSSAVDTNLIESNHPYQLRIFFKDTQPDLVRKIPIERSAQINAIRLVQRHGQLSAEIDLSFRQLRVDSFPLQNPPRLAVDIYKASAIAASPNASDPSIVENFAVSENRPILYTEMNQKHLPEPLDRIVLASNTQQQIVETTLAQAMLSTAKYSTNDTEHPKLLAQTNPIAPQTRTDSQAITDVFCDTSAQPVKKGLQYYLLIALVLLTILILILLVLMLLLRHRWVEQKKPLRTKALFNRQDEHIAAINAQIEAQLKRYDEI